MSDLRTQINNDVKEAMKAKDTVKRDSLRLLTSAFKQIEVDERKDLSDEEVMAIITKQVKQRQDSITQFTEAGRDDLADKEKVEVSYFMAYMPAQLTASELEQKIQAIIQKVGATSMKDMGKVMGAASKELAGTTNGKAINETVKKLLG